MKTIIINKQTIPVSIVRSAKRKKSLAMSVDAQGVHVRIPLSCPISHVDNFLRTKESWIAKHRAKASQRQQIKDDFIHGHAIPFLGSKYPLEIVYSNVARGKLTYDNDKFCLVLPRNTSTGDQQQLLQKYLKKRYIEQAREIISQEVIRCEKEFGLVVQELYIKNYKAKYGQCRGQEVFFSYKIVQFPLAIIRHIVCHELAHLEHKNHGPYFKALLRRMDPDTPHHEKRIREHGIMLE